MERDSSRAAGLDEGARILQEQINDSLGDDSEAARACRRVWRHQRNAHIMQAEMLDPSGDVPAVPAAVDEVYKLVETPGGSIGFEQTTEHHLSEDELSDTVQRVLIEHPELALELGLTEDMPVQQLAYVLFIENGERLLNTD